MLWFFHFSSRLKVASDVAVTIWGVTLRVNQIHSKHERDRGHLSALAHLVVTSGPAGCLSLILSSEKPCFHLFIHRNHPFSLKCSDDIYFCWLQLSRNCEGSHFKEKTPHKNLCSLLGQTIKLVERAHLDFIPILYISLRNEAVFLGQSRKW